MEGVGRFNLWERRKTRYIVSKFLKKKKVQNLSLSLSLMQAHIVIFNNFSHWYIFFNSLCVGRERCTCMHTVIFNNLFPIDIFSLIYCVWDEDCTCMHTIIFTDLIFIDIFSLIHCVWEWGIAHTPKKKSNTQRDLDTLIYQNNNNNNPKILLRDNNPKINGK